MDKSPYIKLFYSSKYTRLVLAIFGLFLLDISLGSLILAYCDIPFGNVRVLHPFYNHGFKEGSSDKVSYGYFHPVYYINSMGMKDMQNREVAATNNKRRILFLGDSFTEGVGYPFDSTFCGYLQKQLDTAKFEILNAGVASFSPKLYYLRLDYLLNQNGLKVNDVFCFLDYSDISDELFYQDFNPHLPDFWNGACFTLQKFFRNYSLIYYVYSKISIAYFLKFNNLSQNLQFFYWIKEGNRFSAETNYQFQDFKENWIEKDKINLPVTQKALKLTKENLTRLSNLCNTHHIKLHLVIYPSADQTFDDSVLGDNKSLTYDDTYEGRYVKIWQSFANENNLAFINLFPLFVSKDSSLATINRKQFYITNDSHWNAAGHKKVTDTLSAIILK